MPGRRRDGDYVYIWGTGKEERSKVKGDEGKAQSSISDWEVKRATWRMWHLGNNANPGGVVRFLSSVQDAVLSYGIYSGKGDPKKLASTALLGVGFLWKFWRLHGKNLAKHTGEEGTWGWGERAQTEVWGEWVYELIQGSITDTY